MIRSIELVRLVQEAIPPALIPVFRLITEFGSAYALLAALTLWYWLDGRDRRRSAFVLAMALCGYGLTTALKDAFALPRPPASLHLVPISGYGFPSGHAIESTVVYGTLAIVLSIGTRRQRAAGTVLAIGLVALSRVVLGVHYPADVAGGIAVGGAFLAGASRLTRYDPLGGFALAAALAVVAFVVGGSSVAVVVFGASAGGALAWWWLGPPPEIRSRKANAAITAVGLGTLAVGAALIGSNDPLALRTLAAVLGVGGIVALPTVAYRAATMRRRWFSLPSN